MSMYEADCSWQQHEEELAQQWEEQVKERVEFLKETKYHPFRDNAIIDWVDLNAPLHQKILEALRVGNHQQAGILLDGALKACAEVYAREEVNSK